MSLIVASSLLAIACAQYAPMAPAPACNPGCIGGGACMGGACHCASPAVVYSPVVGCAPMPVAPAPVVAPALPGSPCEPGVECTGGSVCSLGICTCPPELVQEGTVCISRTVYSVIPPPAV
ncbi:EB module, partial [Oesophagostomum dentatum]